MTFYKMHIPSGKKTSISRDEAIAIISHMYGKPYVIRNFKYLLNGGILGIGMFTNLIYKPTVENYCKEQGCDSNPEKCGYYPSMCIKEKYGVE
jgi:hypothetical protein